MSLTGLQKTLAAADEVAADGDLNTDLPALEELDDPGRPVTLPDGRVIYPSRVLGMPLDELGATLLSHPDPTRRTFLRLTGPPGTGKTWLARCISYRLWEQEGRSVQTRHGQPFYGFVEIAGGPSSDEYLFRYDYTPDAEDSTRIRLVESVFVEAMRNGWRVMIDEVNTIRDVALLSLNASLDGRLQLHLPATGETVRAADGFAVMLAYNPTLVGATDIPTAWFSRFPAAVEVTSNWAGALALGTPPGLVRAAAKLDRIRLTGGEVNKSQLAWTPQFRELEALTRQADLIGWRHAIALYASDLSERRDGGQITDAEAYAAMRMLDEAGYGEYKVGARSGVPSLYGYPRAIAR